MKYIMNTYNPISGEKIQLPVEINYKKKFGNFSEWTVLVEFFNNNVWMPLDYVERLIFIEINTRKLKTLDK